MNPSSPLSLEKGIPGSSVQSPPGGLAALLICHIGTLAQARGAARAGGAAWVSQKCSTGWEHSLSWLSMDKIPLGCSWSDATEHEQCGAGWRHVELQQGGEQQHEAQEAEAAPQSTGGAAGAALARSRGTEQQPGVDHHQDGARAALPQHSRSSTAQSMMPEPVFPGTPEAAGATLVQKTGTEQGARGRFPWHSRGGTSTEQQQDARGSFPCTAGAAPAQSRISEPVSYGTAGGAAPAQNTSRMPEAVFPGAAGAALAQHRMPEPVSYGTAGAAAPA